MRAPDTARTWKDHRRECGRCDLGNPRCDVGREIFEAHQAARSAPRDSGVGSQGGFGSAGGLLLALGIVTLIIGGGFAYLATQAVGLSDLYLMNGAILVSVGIAEMIVGRAFSRV